MENITFDVVIIFALGLLLLIVAGVQYSAGKVYTRAGRGLKWNKKSVVSRNEAPHLFWIIIGLQFIIGLALTLVSAAEIYNRLS
jgi:hypothetical protein